MSHENLRLLLYKLTSFFLTIFIRLLLALFFFHVPRLFMIFMI